MEARGRGDAFRELRGAIAMIRDIAARRRAEEALVRSETKYRALYDSIDDAILLFNGTVFFDCNRSALRLFGLTEVAEFCLLHPADLSPEKQPCGNDSRILAQQHIETVLTEGYERFEWMHKRCDNGASFPAEVTLTAVNLDGRVFIHSVIRNISERKAFEAALIGAREKADARSDMLERIIRREPLEEVLGGVSSFLQKLLPGSQCFICPADCSGYSSATTVAGCAPPSLRRGPLRTGNQANEQDQVKTVGFNPVNGDGIQAAFSWPVLDAARKRLAVMTVFPPEGKLPEPFVGDVDIAAQVVALAIDSRRMYDELTHLSQHDSLTGLPNRVFLDEYLASALRDEGGECPSVAIAYLDLDEFKVVNDLYGHASGDAFLRIAAARMKSVLRPSELLTRIGGDEFLVVFAGLDRRDEAVRRAQRLLESLRDPFVISDSLRLTCTASIGIAMFPEDGASIDELKQYADGCMYGAKSAGKNRVQARDPMTLKRDQFSAVQLRTAIDENCLSVHFQPIFLDTGRLSGFEALARIETASGHAVAPAQFIQVAEKTGLIVRLGRSVLRVACRQASIWERETRAGIKIAVNASARQFADPLFADEVLAVVTANQLPGELLELEITETAVLKDLAGAARQIQRLRAGGIRIGLDDFGTGNSSLSLLRSLPPDFIKLDRSFVKNLTPGGPAIHIVRAIFALTCGLGMRTVAEGIEDVVQLQALLDLGCTAFQGYALARPMSAESVAGRLRGWLSPVRCVTERLERPRTRPTGAGAQLLEPEATNVEA